MRMHIRHLIVFSFLLMATIASRSQTPIVLDTNPPPVAPTRTPVKTSGTAKAAYDKLRDITYANSAPISLKLPDGGWGSLSARFSSEGKDVQKPNRIVIHLFTAAKSRAYLDRPDVILVLGDRNVFEGKAEIVDARTNGAEIYVAFEFSLPFK